jgi:hypothetical protein
MTQGKAKIVLMGVVGVQLAKKNIEAQIKQVKIKEIFMFFHLNHGNYGKLLLIHTYEYEEIRTKNPFDDILDFLFDLKHFKMNTYCVKRSNRLRLKIHNQSFILITNPLEGFSITIQTVFTFVIIFNYFISIISTSLVKTR